MIRDSRTTIPLIQIKICYHNVFTLVGSNQQTVSFLPAFVHVSITRKGKYGTWGRMIHRDAWELEFLFSAPAPLALTSSQGTEGTMLQNYDINISREWCKRQVEQRGDEGPGAGLEQEEDQALQVCQPPDPRSHMRWSPWHCSYFHLAAWFWSPVTQ